MEFDAKGRGIVGPLFEMAAEKDLPGDLLWPPENLQKLRIGHPDLGLLFLSAGDVIAPAGKGE
jgi:hypothetical protein